MKKAIVPGSFDPITMGHLDMIERAASMFEFVYVIVMVNGEKSTRFTLDERLQMASAALSHLKNVKVEASDALLADYAAERGVSVLVRGARSGSDFDYEHMLAQINTELNRDLDTVILPSKKETAYISSTYVRELIKYKKTLCGAVPPEAIELILKFEKNNTYPTR